MIRKLTPYEEGLLNLVRAYERAIEDKRLTIAIQLNEEQLKQVMVGEEIGYFKGPCGLVERRDEQTGMPYFYTVFYLTDFDGYLHYVFQDAGMAILKNYTVALNDGYVVDI